MNLANLDLNLLVSLDALLRERNVTAAGEAVGLSQPAMSSALSRLRRLFDDDLLVRVGREYHLTALAQQLEEQVPHILRQIEQTFEARPTFDPSTDHRTFTISASDYAAFLLIQPLIQRVASEAPAVSIEVLPVAQRWRQALSTGETDLLILPSTIGPDQPSQVLFQDRYVCVLSRDNDAFGDTITLEQYLSLPGITYGRGISSVESIGDLALETTALRSHVRFTVESFFLMPFLLKGTDLVALVHKRLARSLQVASDIRIAEPLFETPTVMETMYWHPRHSSDPAHRWLRQVLLDIAGSL